MFIHGKNSGQAELFLKMSNKSISTFKDRVKDFCYRELFPQVGLLFVKLISKTYHYKLVGTQHEQQVYETHGTVIYASWHQRFFPGIAFFSTRKPIAIRISQSRDGEMIARLVDILGWQSVRGSSSKGGMQALKQLRSLTKQGYRVGHIVDGPQGPVGVVKPGLITIAQFAGSPIVPTIASAERYWTASSWDRFMVPKLFSKVVLRFARPIPVPRRLNEKEFETLRKDVQEQMEKLYTETDHWWKNSEKRMDQ